jgi:hypothetical protein
MIKRLPFFVNNSKRFAEYKVEIKEESVEEEYSEESWTKLILVFSGKVGDNWYELKALDTAFVSYWDTELTAILKDIAIPLGDFSKYEWEAISTPIVNYWVEEQKGSVTNQLKKGKRSFSRPAYDPLQGIITEIMIAKYSVLQETSILKFLKDKRGGFEGDFIENILKPLQTYVAIESVVASKIKEGEKVKKIIDLVILSCRQGGICEDILDPNFKDDTAFLSRDERRELNSLFKLFDNLEKEINSNTKYSDMEKRIRVSDFFETQQGKRLNLLNSRRVRGGTLSFKKKEKRKRERVGEITEMLGEILLSWRFESKDVEKGLQYYQDLYEKEAYQRFTREREWQKSINTYQEKMNAYKTIQIGKWEESSLSFLGILLGLVVGVVFGVLSFVDSCHWFWGILSFIGSIVFIVLLVKCKYFRKKLSEISSWFLD